MEEDLELKMSTLFCDLEYPDASEEFIVLDKQESEYFNNSIEKKREKVLEEQKERRYQTPDYTFVFKLMFTTWFREIPEDLEENWLIKCVPVGVRVLLVSQQNLTVCYVDNKCVLKLKSNFSGGGGSDIGNGSTVLDCIYNKKTKTIFILDCLCWNDMCMIDFEADFRFYWLKSKFADCPTLYYCENFKFVLVDFIPAQRTLIQDAMCQSFHFNDKKIYYDGVTFYHKKSHYECGRRNSPLVGWLASYMLTEILNIEVSAEHLVKKPKKYEGAAAYIRFLKFRSRRKQKKRNKDTVLEIVVANFCEKKGEDEEGEIEIDGSNELKIKLANFHRETGNNEDEELEIESFLIV